MFIEIKSDFELESAVRTLLAVLGSEESSEPQIAFEVDLDGRRYAVSIVQSIADTLRPHLSPREIDIAQLIARGLPTKTIATMLGLRPCTVSTYTKRIYLKLNVNSRAEMVAKVLSKPSLHFYRPRTPEN